MSREKSIIYLSRIVSMVFTPFYLPLMGLILLFTFSYLASLPVDYKLEVIAVVYLFTILVPTIFIHFYRKYHGWTLIELGMRERRMVPYVLSIVCYLMCVWLLRYMNVFHFVSSILMAALLVQMVCAIINVWWKVSTHTAAIGGVAGALFSFSEIFGFNPVCWLCLTFLVGGVMGSARMILRQHTLPQVVAGFFVGLVCAAIGILFL